METPEHLSNFRRLIRTSNQAVATKQKMNMFHGPKEKATNLAAYEQEQAISTADEKAKSDQAKATADQDYAIQQAISKNKRLEYLFHLLLTILFSDCIGAPIFGERFSSNPFLQEREMSEKDEKGRKQISFETDLISTIMSDVILIVGFLINVKSHLLVAFGIPFTFYCIQAIISF